MLATACYVPVHVEGETRSPERNRYGRQSSHAHVLRPEGRAGARRPSARDPRQERRHEGDGHLDPAVHRLRPAQVELVLAGGDSEDLIQEGLIGLYKAVRDFRSDKETSFRSFAELCITRQIITAIKTATRFKHSPLNTYVSFSQTPRGAGVRGRLHPGRRASRPGVDEPSIMVISTEELQSLVFCLGTGFRSSSRTRFACISRARPTRRWPSA